MHSLGNPELNVGPSKQATKNLNVMFAFLQIIEIPYEGGQSSMIIVLPYSNNGLGVLLRALKVAPELLNRSLAKLKQTDVILSMPKFKIESEMNLNSLYKKVSVRFVNTVTIVPTRNRHAFV